MGNYNPMPYVTKILKENLIKEQKYLSIFEKNLNSDNFFEKRQAEEVCLLTNQE